jgi:hypothetical protein
MRSTTTRRVLERIFGFAEPTATRDGRVTYECLYCGATADDGHPAHALDCPYWLAHSALATPAAARLVAQALG